VSALLLTSTFLLKYVNRNSTAHRSGVTVATVSLAKKDIVGAGSSIIAGLSTTFRTGAANAMQRGAIVQEVAALHVVIGRPHPLSWTRKTSASVSEEIAALRRLLFGFESVDTQTGHWFKQAIEGGKVFLKSTVRLNILTGPC